MNDRFRFRAGFTVSFYDIDGNDIERQIILDSCFSIDSGGDGICVNEEIIQEALDIYVAKDEHRLAWDSINAYYAEADGYYFIDNIDFLEQCTGITDKNDKLVYEGDIIKVENNICSISFDGENSRYDVSGYGELAYLNYNEIEVIGNIHENKELLDEQR